MERHSQFLLDMRQISAEPLGPQPDLDENENEEEEDLSESSLSFNNYEPGRGGWHIPYGPAWDAHKIRSLIYLKVR